MRLADVPATGIGIALGASCLLAACGGSTAGSGGTASSADSPSVVSQSSAAVATTARLSTGVSAGACSPSPALVAAGKKFGEITDLSLIGGCGQVTAATTLAPGALGSPSAGRAIAICRALSKVAYSGAVFGVSVDGKDGHELATSTKDQRQCI